MDDSSLRISAGSQDYVGLFGSVGSSGVIRNVDLIYVNDVTGNDYVGALVGDNNGTVTDSRLVWAAIKRYPATTTSALW